MLPEIEEKLGRIIDKLERVPLDALGNDMKKALASLDDTFRDARGVLQQFDADVMPALKSTLSDARGALGSAERMLTSTEANLVGPGAPGQAELRNALGGARAAAACACCVPRTPPRFAVRGKPAGHRPNAIRLLLLVAVGGRVRIDAALALLHAERAAVADRYDGRTRGGGRPGRDPRRRGPARDRRDARRQRGVAGRVQPLGISAGRQHRDRHRREPDRHPRHPSRCAGGTNDGVRCRFCRGHRGATLESIPGGWRSSTRSGAYAAKDGVSGRTTVRENVTDRGYDARGRP